MRKSAALLMKVSRLFGVLGFLLASLFLNLQLRSQAGPQGLLQGSVVDPSGAVIAGATVRATDPQRALTFIATTNREGLFRFSALPVGTYQIKVEHPGFSEWVANNIDVTVGAQINLRIDLTMAGVSESVVVSSAPPNVETARTAVSFAVDSKAVSSLPANGRNYLDFVLLTPGVTRGSRGFDLSFAGQRKMNLLRVDGADNDNTYFTEVLGLSSSGFAPYQFSMASVQEFQVSTNSYSAELGRAGAGLISVVTKSGTNDFHGSGFWYYRDRSMNASDLVNKINSLPKSPYHFNQFGGTLGGPVLKNRLFFFAAYDGQRSKLQNSVSLNLPPGFSLSSNSTIASFQERALAYLLPRASSWLRTFDQDVTLVKSDWWINPKQLFSARWNRQSFTGGNLVNFGPQDSLEHTGNSLTATDTFGGSITSFLSPSVANTFLFAYVLSREESFVNSSNPEANVFESGQLALRVGRAANGLAKQHINRLQFSDTFSILLGRHAMKFGGDVLPNWIDAFGAGNFSGSFRFPSLESFGRSLAAAPPAFPDQRLCVQSFSGNGTHGFEGHPDFVDYASFVQDEWRIQPRLTLNLGLRYDLQVIRKPTVRNPSSALAAAGLDTSELRTDANNVAPRLGLAWDPLRNNRFVLRAGYGLFYARTPSIITQQAYRQNGITTLTATFSGSSNASLIPNYPNSLCGPPDPSGLPPNCAAPLVGNQLLLFFAPGYTQPYTQQASFGLETEFAKDWVVSASYLMVKGTRLQRVQDVNLATPETRSSIGIAQTNHVLTYNQFTLPRPIAGFDRVELMESAANSAYHAVVLQVRKSFSDAFWLSGAYTLSKTIDDNPEPIALNLTANDGLLLSDATNPPADRGPGVNDQRHRLVLSGIWQPGTVRSGSRLLRSFLGGWELSAIFTAQTGLPYSPLVSFDLNNDGNSSNDRTPGVGRNTFYLPVTASLDPRVTKTLTIRENLRLQFAAEAFNILNHGNVTAVRTTQFARSNNPAVCGVAGAPCLVLQNSGLNAFGTPTATSGPRIGQLSAKLIF